MRVLVWLTIENRTVASSIIADGEEAERRQFGGYFCDERLHNSLLLLDGGFEVQVGGTIVWDLGDLCESLHPQIDISRRSPDFKAVNLLCPVQLQNLPLIWFLHFGLLAF